MSDELLKAIIHHDLDEMAQALARGADPNVIFTELNGWRPLHAAVDALEHGASIASLVLLLRCGADVEAWDAAHTVNPLLMALFRDLSSSGQGSVERYIRFLYEEEHRFVQTPLIESAEDQDASQTGPTLFDMTPLR